MMKSLVLLLVALSVLGFGLIDRAVAQVSPATPSGTVLKPAEIAKQLETAKADHRLAIDDAKKALLHTIERSGPGAFFPSDGDGAQEIPAKAIEAAP
jgi:hypothetical protein